MLLTDEVEFECYEKAILHEEKDKWFKVMQEEMKSLHEKHTFELGKLPQGKRPLKDKWVFKLKSEDNNSQPRYKTRLVVKGFGQKKRIDFEEIFSPVVKMSSIRVVLGLVASLNLEIDQLDVKTAFFHDDLEEERYNLKVFQLKEKKILFANWERAYMGSNKLQGNGIENLILSRWITNDKTSSDHCVFVKKFPNKKYIILLLYVDDMLIVGHDKNDIQSLKRELSKSFAMKDLGPAK